MKAMCIPAALAIVVGATAMASTPVPADGPGHAKERANSVYIVQMSADPVVAYKGNINGYQATKPARARRSTRPIRTSSTTWAISMPATTTLC